MIARFIDRFALWIVGLWFVAAVVANGMCPHLEALTAARDQPFMPTGTASWQALQHSAAAFSKPPTDNLGYVVLQRDGPLTDRDRAFCDQLVAALDADDQHVTDVVDWWAVPVMAARSLSADHQVATVFVRLSGLVGTTHANESVQAVRKTVADLHPPDGLQVFVTGPGATVMDEFAAIYRQIEFIAPATLAALLVLLLIFDRSPVAVMVPLVTVALALSVAKPIVAVLVERGDIGISVFAIGLSIAVVAGVGTGFAIFLLGRYQERRRQGFAPADAFADAYRGVAPTIIGSTLIVILPLACVTFLDFARLNVFGSTGALLTIGVLVVAAATLTFTSAVIALAGRADLLKPPARQRARRRLRRIGIYVARWPAPILVASGVLLFILMVGLPAVPIGWDESAATPANAESNRGYQAVDRHFAANQLLPDVVTIQTDHDIRNPADLVALKQITAAIMAIPGVRMVLSASHPTGMVSKQAAYSTSAGNLGDRLDEFSDAVAARGATFAALESAIGDMTKSIDLIENAMQLGPYGIGGAGLAVHLMQESIAKVRSRAADISDIFAPLRNFVSSLPDCRTTPVCVAADEAVQWSNAVVDGSMKLANGAEQLGQQVADVAAKAGPSDLPIALSTVIGQLEQLRTSATGVNDIVNNPRPLPVPELPGYFQKLAAASQDSPGGDLYASRRILTDPTMRVLLNDFISANGRATRLIVYGDGQEWGSDGAQRARAIVAAVADATDGGALQPTAVELTGVGPATRDLQDLLGGDLLRVVATTLVVIFVIAALLLRSPVAGFVVVVTIAISYLCALGASVLIWQRIFGQALHWSVLPIAFVLVVAVGSACNLLFALRIREERWAGQRTSVIRAYRATGGIATVAGIVVGATMLALVASQVLSIAQIGVTVGLGLLIDALVVRAFVLPAVMVVLGRWLWFPRRQVSYDEDVSEALTV
ncbi:RND family transporter [Mycobacterium riyadhense]|uniref:Transporter n=1 Tax=Mycobacterium riyadhense TaxID=486698 RepID=A0A1X2B539_9MYCO|nr:RND family transporter [Mycobacterium riyadhense]MCV7147573.1 RND family transporter [Mycobacterium riyadhense]ORW58786.1 transporter [Mycobacterium riyadhense]VTP00821.1 Membrane transport protein mmpL8 [Mycobacterium riyadhense]